MQRAGSAQAHIILLDGLSACNETRGDDSGDGEG